MKHTSRGFTLVEMLMVMVIIAIIASLIVGVAGYAQRKGAQSRALGEIKAMELACESYKTDNGSYPREVGITESIDDSPAPIDPRLHGSPTAANYQNASKFLYQQLSGDDNLDGRAGDSVGTPPTPLKVYHEFKPAMLAFNPAKTAINYLQDPYGNSYGYSTAGAKMEDLYREQAKVRTASKQKVVERTSTATKGFNSTFDLWSTAGTTTDPPTDLTRLKWVKNW
jgi:prepilin-type N-terminal cleavage/methylation domain-containing protein